MPSGDLTFYHTKEIHIRFVAVNGSLLARKSGRSHGLRLVLNVEEDEYTRSIDGYLGTGFMVTID